MTLVDRYLRAVRDNLPRGQQDDIINELSDNLQSRIEDEAATRGRPLLETEEAEILKEFGHPMAVAARYRGDERSVTFGRRLVGPELFPTYMKVLAVNVVITGLLDGSSPLAPNAWATKRSLLPFPVRLVAASVRLH
jgi:HAAS domain-containing protein